MIPEPEIAPEGNILIIDDSPENLRMLSQTLMTYGYIVRCVTNGSMALTSIQHAPPDLILLDIRMPGLDGYQVCQQLKRNPETQDIPVIFLSVLEEVKDIVKAFEVGGVDYITKPFQTEEVLARIQNQLTIQTLRKQLSLQNQYLLHEINERKKFEQALCQEIQHRLLIETSLQDVKNVAEAADYTKRELLAQMSHELRTPLNIILGFTSLMQGEDTLTPSQQEYLATVNDSAQHLLKLINKILSIAHTASSQPVLFEREFDLHQLLALVISLWQTKTLEKGLQFEFYQAPDLPRFIQADENKFRQILMNLLDAALQATETGAIVVKIDVENKDSLDSNGICRLVFEIHQMETEYSSNKLDISFQSFSQTTFSQSSTQQLGMSLLLVRQFAQVMGGDVFFESDSAKGTIACVHLLVKLADSSPGLTQRDIQLSSYPTQSTPEEIFLSMEALQHVMSGDWLAQLHQAAVKGFDQQVLQLIQKIPANFASLATTLEVWAHNFQFDRIVAVIRRTARFQQLP